jgi:hypothetical protein
MRRKSQARAQRRLYEKYLKELHPGQYKIWKQGSIERGQKVHEQNTEEISQSIETQYEALQTRLIQYYKSLNMSNEEIDAYIENWVKTIKVWGSSSRPMRWREIRREEKSEA